MGGCLLQTLSPHLQARITNLVNSTLIRRVPFFKTAEERCISLVVWLAYSDSGHAISSNA